MDKNLDDYLALRYTIWLIPDQDGRWRTEIPELPGCVSMGNTKHEAFELIEDAKRLWISARIEAGERVPEPFQPADPIGVENTYTIEIEQYRSYPVEDRLRIVAFEMARYTSTIYGHSEMLCRMLEREMAPETMMIIKASCEQIREKAQQLEGFRLFLKKIN